MRTLMDMRDYVFIKKVFDEKWKYAMNFDELYFMSSSVNLGMKC